MPALTPRPIACPMLYPSPRSFYFPHDAIRLILDSVFADGDRLTTLSCSLVWPACTHVCQRVLYETFSVRGEQRPGDFRKAFVFLGNNPRIAGYVKSLRLLGALICTESGGFEGCEAGGELDMEILECFFRELPQLESLTISNCTWCGDDRKPAPFKIPQLNTVVLENVCCAEEHANVLQVRSGS